MRIVFFLIVGLIMGSCSEPTTEITSEKVKVAWRTVGHQLLLAQQDTTSLVLPIEEVNRYTYRLKFQEHLSIAPDSLVAIVQRVFDKASMPKHYIVEVVDCTDMQVAYSYQMEQTNDTEIIPCKGRHLPKACYFIAVKFLEQNNSTTTWQVVLLFGFLIIVLTGYYFYKKRHLMPTAIEENKTMSLGSFIFYPDQLKLVKQAVEIKLSKKECELLEMLVANCNKIITREELTKKIWEDNGVFVGRSLDTYVSKLRKKLKDDNRIKLVNIHGVGYKLEIIDA